MSSEVHFKGAFNLIRAFLSNMSKNIAFSISKSNFIIYNTPLYNTTCIKTSIFFFLPFHLNNVSLLFFNNFLFFLSLLYLSLSHSTAGTTLQTTHQKPTTHTTTTTNKKKPSPSPPPANPLPLAHHKPHPSKTKSQTHHPKPNHKPTKICPNWNLCTNSQPANRNLRHEREIIIDLNWWGRVGGQIGGSGDLATLRPKSREIEWLRAERLTTSRDRQQAEIGDV